MALMGYPGKCMRQYKSQMFTNANLNTTAVNTQFIHTVKKGCYDPNKDVFLYLFPRPSQPAQKAPSIQYEQRGVGPRMESVLRKSHLWRRNRQLQVEVCETCV